MSILYIIIGLLITATLLALFLQLISEQDTDDDYKKGGGDE